MVLSRDFPTWFTRRVVRRPWVGSGRAAALRVVVLFYIFLGLGLLQNHFLAFVKLDTCWFVWGFDDHSWPSGYHCSSIWSCPDISRSGLRVWRAGRLLVEWTSCRAERGCFFLQLTYPLHCFTADEHLQWYVYLYYLCLLGDHPWPNGYHCESIGSVQRFGGQAYAFGVPSR